MTKELRCTCGMVFKQGEEVTCVMPKSVMKAAYWGGLLDAEEVSAWEDFQKSGRTIL